MIETTFQEGTTEEERDSVEIKDSNDDGFSELIPLDYFLVIAGIWVPVINQQENI